MKIITTVILTAINLASCPQDTQTTLPEENQKPVKSFTQWCKEQTTLPEETQYTIEALLNKAGTQDCEQANQKLSNLTTLEFENTQISDLKPFSSFNNLTSLGVLKSRVCDIKPLANLTNLTILDLRGNLISDLKPLSNLTNLTYLNLWVNKISD